LDTAKKKSCKVRERGGENHRNQKTTGGGTNGAYGRKLIEVGESLQTTKKYCVCGGKKGPQEKAREKKLKRKTQRGRKTEKDTMGGQ